MIPTRSIVLSLEVSGEYDAAAFPKKPGECGVFKPLFLKEHTEYIMVEIHKNNAGNTSIFPISSAYTAHALLKNAALTFNLNSSR